LVGRAGVSTLSAVVCAFLKVNTGTIAAGFVFCASYHTGRSDTFEAGTTGVVAFSAMCRRSFRIDAGSTAQQLLFPTSTHALLAGLTAFAGVVAFSAMSAGSLWINATDTTA
jgi:hypothetical protein